MVKCIIFDCDGTLVDSEYLSNLGLAIKLREYAVDVSAIEMMARFQGVRLQLIIEQIESENQISLGNEFIPSYRSLVAKLFEERLKPCEGVAEMLDAIQLPICVASSGPPEKIRKSLSLTGLLEYFDERLFSSYDIGSWKPDPGIFAYASRKMGVSINECVVVEDSPVGVSAAISAGAKPIHYNPNGIHAPIDGAYKMTHMRELEGLISSFR